MNPSAFVRTAVLTYNHFHWALLMMLLHLYRVALELLTILASNLTLLLFMSLSQISLNNLLTCLALPFKIVNHPLNWNIWEEICWANFTKWARLFSIV